MKQKEYFLTNSLEKKKLPHFFPVLRNRVLIDVINSH